jgi:hypothetical protein
MNHDGCPRAVRDGDYWRCVGCGERLAWATPSSTVTLRDELIPLSSGHDGITAYGLPPRTLTTGKEGRAQARKRTWRGLNFGDGVYVYCPRPGRCGRGQHIDLRRP